MIRNFMEKSKTSSHQKCYKLQYLPGWARKIVCHQTESINIWPQSFKIFLYKHPWGMPGKPMRVYRNTQIKY